MAVLRGEVTKIDYSRNTFVYNSEILIFLPVEKSSFNFFPEQVKCLNIFYTDFVKLFHIETPLYVFLVVKPRANGRNIVGQQLPTLLDVTCYVRLHALLHVVGCCCVLLCKV